MLRWLIHGFCTFWFSFMSFLKCLYCKFYFTDPWIHQGIIIVMELPSLKLLKTHAKPGLNSTLQFEKSVSWMVYNSATVIPHLFIDFFISFIHLWVRVPLWTHGWYWAHHNGPDWTQPWGTFPIYVSQRLDVLAVLLAPNRKCPPIAK